MLIQADARQIPLADGCVQCVVTSPPYFGLRDYGTANQIGLEPTPDAFVAALVAVFREVRRVLADDGVLWLNLGDSYSATQRSAGASMASTLATKPTANKTTAQRERGTWRTGTDAKPKDLLGIPWRVAFALQADGWYLRSDIIWHKPNPMPESVTDRPTKAHEYLFLLTKSERYHYAADAIAEDASGRACGNRTYKYDGLVGHETKHGILKVADKEWHKRNARTVWTIPTMPYAGAHFATMPEKLVEPCILAGSRLGDRVLDPFMGSGTVGAVAERLGRRWVGLDLNPAYHQLAKKRTAQRGLKFGS